ncbi:hypothetical protein RhiirA4_486612 [Rhizophagus irregularis]|uniref:Uncharacterized protein n=1 Tax=Rhizophagus irregularis TaxID=588596 RepID=A0A2I1HRJ6_9GLOM|nr:hypothetical protein RhiirA4_486612 [Rhizophagus irregularis]
MVVDDFNNLNNEKNVNTESSEYKVSDKLEINSNYVMQDDHKKEQTKKHSLDINDNDDEKQDELEISGNVSKKLGHPKNLLLSITIFQTFFLYYELYSIV